MKTGICILLIALFAGIGGYILKSRAPMITVYAEADILKFKITYDHGECLNLGPINRGEKRSFEIMKKESNILLESFDANGSLKGKDTFYYTNPFITDIYCTVSASEIKTETSFIQ